MNLLHPNPTARNDHTRALRAMENQFQGKGFGAVRNVGANAGGQQRAATRSFKQKMDDWHASLTIQTEELKPKVEVKEVLIDIPKLPKVQCGIPELTPVTLPAESELEGLENETRKMSDTIGELESKLEELESKMTTLGAAVVSIKQYSELNDGLGRQSVERLRQINNLNDSENEIERITRFMKNLFGI